MMRILSVLALHLQVEELQQKVRVLQAVGYGAMEVEDGSDTGATASLEAAILAKARRLEHELTMTRLRVAELSGESMPWWHVKGRCTKCKVHVKREQCHCVDVRVSRRHCSSCLQWAF